MRDSINNFWLRVTGYAGGLIGLIVLMWTPHTWQGGLIFGGLLCIWLLAAAVFLHRRSSSK
jgi:uncharacterized membrane protein YccC